MKLGLTGELAAWERSGVSEVGKRTPSYGLAPCINHCTDLPVGLGTLRFGLTLS